MTKASYYIVNNVKTEGRYKQTVDDSKFEVHISFEKDNKKNSLVLEFTWSVDGDFVDGQNVDCSRWCVDVLASDKVLQDFKESFPDFVMPEGGRFSAEDEIAGLEHDLEKAGIVKA